MRFSNLRGLFLTFGLVTVLLLGVSIGMLPERGQKDTLGLSDAAVAHAAVLDDPMPIAQKVRIVALNMEYLFEVVAITWQYGELDMDKLALEVLPAVMERVSENADLYGRMIARVLDQEQVLEETGILGEWKAKAETIAFWPVWPWPWPWPWWDCYPAPDALLALDLIRQVIEEGKLENGGFVKLIEEKPKYAADIIAETLLRTAEHVISEAYASRLEILTREVIPLVLDRFARSPDLLQAWSGLMDQLGAYSDNAALASASAMLAGRLAEAADVIGADVSEFARYEPIYHGTLIAVLLSSSSLVSATPIPIP